ncbi:MAG: TonB-dependent receptor plug domain-containing protein [Candidatus Cryptobacteroides sp.]
MKKHILTILLIRAEALLSIILAQPGSVSMLLDGTSVSRAVPSADTISTSHIRTSALPHDTPGSYFSGDMLRRIAPASAADALEFFPGVRIKDYGGIGGLKTVDVRSLGSGHVGIFLDGQRITNAQNGQIDLGRYSPDELESISVTNAQRTSLLMSADEYASASVVHLRTRVPVFGEKDWNLTARLKTGSWGTFSPSLRVEKKFRKAALSADAAMLRSDGDYRFRLVNEHEDSTGRRKGGDISSCRFSMGLWASPFGGSLSLGASAYTSDRGLPGPVIRRLSDLYEPSERQKDSERSLQASFRKSFGSCAILVNSKASSDRLEYESSTVGGKTTLNHFNQRVASLSMSVSWQPSRFISGGLSLDNRLSDLDCDVKDFNHVLRIDTRAAAALRLYAGGFTLQPSLLFTRVEDFTEKAAKPLKKFSPAVIASWENGSGTVAARAFYKDIFRVPTFNDLYYTLTGNAAIRPEYARQADIGFDLDSPDEWKHHIRLSADGYLNRVRDKIVAVPVNSQFRWSMMNFGEVRGGGVTLQVSHGCNLSGFDLNSLFTYSFEKATDRSDPGNIGYGGQIPYTPFHSGSAVMTAARGQWEFSASILFSGKRYSASDNNPDTLLKGWNTTDLTISRTFPAKGRTRLKAAIDISNLFCARYEIVRRYPMPGTGANLRITIEIH